MSQYHPAKANPLFGNPLQNRADVAKAIDNLFQPLIPYFSSGSARVRLGSTAALHDTTAVELEGFARPLWGLAPWAAGGGIFNHWDLYRQGLTHGTDPNHPEYWGTPQGTDQRLVEMAAVGFALRLIPHLLWDPLTAAAKKNLVNYLNYAREIPPVNNNWKFFRSLIDLGLEEIGVSVDAQVTDQYFSAIHSFYLGNGWYSDGKARRLDHYLGFSLHFYGLLYATLKRGDSQTCAIFRERAGLFARDFTHWFASDGGALAFGRSLTYRFAAAAFWGATGFAGVDVFTQGDYKGKYLRHLRWWSQLPIADRDGVLSVGYGYSNLLMSEAYNSCASPYWAFKAFLPLALTANHSFWASEETPFCFNTQPIALKHAGMVITQQAGNVTALSAGQECEQMRGGSEKYAKFVYSSRYAFSIENDERMFSQAVFDGMLGLSENGRQFRVRETNEEAKIAGNLLYARWKPWPDVTIETWLIPAGDWHIRVHKISSARVLLSTEGGFAIESGFGINSADSSQRQYKITADTAFVQGKNDISIICDLSKSHPRLPQVHRAPPNTHLIFPKSVIPQLRGTINIGMTVLMTAAAATSRTTGMPAPPPAAPDLHTLELLIKNEGVDVSANKIL